MIIIRVEYPSNIVNFKRLLEFGGFLYIILTYLINLLNGVLNNPVARQNFLRIS